MEIILGGCCLLVLGVVLVVFILLLTSLNRSTMDHSRTGEVDEWQDCAICSTPGRNLPRAHTVLVCGLKCNGCGTITYTGKNSGTSFRNWGIVAFLVGGSCLCLILLLGFAAYPIMFSF
jgi:hypothetical protein